MLAGEPVISEFMAINSNGIVDENLDQPDWLEIHNTQGADLNLDGYYLTDDPNLLTQWRIPAVSIPANGYLRIFASGKDRAVVGQNLHTSFSLDGGGGYLALVRPDGLTVDSSYDYPEQIADVSYGVASFEDVTSLIGLSSPVKVKVPLNNSLGITWRDAGFNDTAWGGTLTGAGYETLGAPTTNAGFSVKQIDINGGSDGIIDNLAQAQSILNNTAPAGAFTAASTNTLDKLSINFGGGLGRFPLDQTMPVGSFSENVVQRTDYAMRISSYVTIPPGVTRRRDDVDKDITM